jgi:hypothetical protein
MIIFNGDYVLKQLLEVIYDSAYKIVIVDGVVKYFADMGYTGSDDNSLNIIKSFPDPDNKIILHENIVRAEKTELCQVFMQSIPDDTDYLFCIDSDELYKPEDIKRLFDVLESEKPDIISMESTAFFGGFNHVLTGHETRFPFRRILKYEKGCKYIEHRPPLLSCTPSNAKVINAKDYGVVMYHYSYVWPLQVKNKVKYYKAAVSQQYCIDNYFETIWLPWVTNPELRQEIEDKWDGVHECVVSHRGDCRTTPFTGTHPDPIIRDMPELMERFNRELEVVINKPIVIDKSTCWYSQDGIDKMNEYYDQHVKNKTGQQLLDEVYHFKVLYELLSFCDTSLPFISLLDLGCGTASLIKCIPIWCTYTGADLPEVIQRSALRNLPNGKFFECDIMVSDLTWIANYDVVVLNAVIDTMQYPVKALERVLRCAGKYVIIHRQEITIAGETRVVRSSSYGGYAYHSIIKWSEFLEIIKKHNFQIISSKILDFEWENGGNSYLLKKVLSIY